MSHLTTKGGIGTIGLDLGDTTSQFCRIDTQGEILAEGKVKTERAVIRQEFERFAGWTVVIETGTHSVWVAEELKAAGIEVIVANARRLRLIYQGLSKTDRLDAQALARVGRMDPKLLYPIQPRAKKTRADLGVVRARDVLVDGRTALINHVRGVIKSWGLRLPKCSTDSFARKVSELIPQALKPALEPVIAMIGQMTLNIANYDRQIEDLIEKEYPQAQRLRQVPGVGAVVALTYMLTIDDPRRFIHSRSLGAYVGLTTRQDQSGKRNPELPITKAGDPSLRRLLVLSAHYILGPFGKDSDLRRWGLKLAERGEKNAKKRAIVAVARKLAVLLHRLWMTGDSYDPLRNSLRREKTRSERSETTSVKEKKSQSIPNPSAN